MGIPQQVAHNLGAANKSAEIHGVPAGEEKGQWGYGVMERLLLAPGGAKAKFLYKILAVLGIPFLSPQYFNQLQRAASEGASDVVKDILNDIKLSRAETEIWLEKVEHGQKYAVIASFVGFTAGAVKELDYVNYAYMAENLPIRGVRMDGSEIITELMAQRGEVQKSATYKELCEAYNAYYDAFYDDDPKKATAKIRQWKYSLNEAQYRKEGKAVEDVEVDQWDHVSFGFHQGVSKRIDTSKEELNLRDLYNLGWWMIRAGKGHDQLRDYLQDSTNPEEKALFQKCFTYKGGIIAPAEDIRKVWVDTTGFTQDIQYNERELQQKWMMFALKGTDKIVNVKTGRETLVSKKFKNDWDYYNRAMGKQMNLWLSKYLREEDDFEKTHGRKSEEVDSLDRLLQNYEGCAKGGDKYQSKAEEQKDIQTLTKFIDKQQERFNAMQLTKDEVEYVTRLSEEHTQRLVQEGKIKPEQAAEFRKMHFNTLVKMVKTAKTFDGKLSNAERDRITRWANPDVDVHGHKGVFSPEEVDLLEELE